MAYFWTSMLKNLIHLCDSLLALYHKQVVLLKMVIFRISLLRKRIVKPNSLEKIFVLLCSCHRTSRSSSPRLIKLVHTFWYSDFCIEWINWLNRSLTSSLKCKLQFYSNVWPYSESDFQLDLSNPFKCPIHCKWVCKGSALQKARSALHEQ